MSHEAPRSDFIETNADGVRCYREADEWFTSLPERPRPHSVDTTLAVRPLEAPFEDEIIEIAGRGRYRVRVVTPEPHPAGPMVRVNLLLDEADV